MMYMIVAVSDVHLGTAHIPSLTSPDRVQFKRFLLYLRDDLQPDHLVLNGDIDDLWRRNIRTLTRENYDIYNLLAELRDEDIQLHYLLGNHDWYARRDRGGKISRYNEPYYDTEYLEERSLTIPEPAEELSLTTHETNYKFMHGHQFDEKQQRWLFDYLALTDGDAIGDEMEYAWVIAKELRGSSNTFRRVRQLIANRIGNTLDEQVEQMDVAESGREAKLGIDPGTAMITTRNKSKIDWLCIGHTHIAGIEPDPISANGGVANSGTWKGGKDTYLLLEERPSLMDWNNGSPSKLESQPG
jgi:UDP-2,3-diacylglucosamine pyrophosphatase LpxH